MAVNARGAPGTKLKPHSEAGVLRRQTAMNTHDSATAPTGQALDAATPRAHCEKQLAPYRRPRRIEFRSALPLTPIGKVLRRAPKEEAARAQAPSAQAVLA